MLKQIHLIHHTHMDVGYTDLPTEVLDQQLGYLDTALNLCEGNDSLPPERQFRWTVESALLVQDYLACRGEAQRERLLRALRRGWIELQAFLTQPLTELASAEEMIELVRYAAELGRREGFPVQCGVVDDIGGYAGRVPTVLSGFGVRYLVAGVGGFQVHLPWADLPHLFHLEGKDGARVLMWNLGCDRTKTPQEMTVLDAVYGLSWPYLITPFRQALMGESAGVEERRQAVAAARERFAAFERRLEDEGYPFDTVMLQYATDNGGPDPTLVELIARINDTGTMPPISLTTPSEYLGRMVEVHGASLPVVRGVITDPWILRANPLPGSLRKFRQAQRDLHAAQSRRALEAGAPIPEEDALADEVTRNLLLYSDHTCGLSEWFWEKEYRAEAGTRAAEYDRYRQSWAFKHSYAEIALRGAARLERLARQRAGASVRTEDAAILLWNDRPAGQSGPVELALARDSAPLAALTDAATGEPVPFQQTGPRAYLLLAPEVPALGYRRLDPVFGPAPAAPAADPAGPTCLESPFLRLSVDPATGRVFSLLDKATGAELVDPEYGPGLGAFVYQRFLVESFGWAQAGMAKGWPTEVLAPRVEQVRRGLCGSVADSVVIEEQVAGPAGPIRVRREVILYHHAPRVDVRVRLDKPEAAAKECCYVAFPLAGREGAFHFDQNLGWVAPTEDLIPGAMQDAFYCNSWANVSGDGPSVTLACPDAPVLQFGRIRTGEWEERLPFRAGSNHIYAYLYHNLLDTDDPIWQEVLDEFRFSLTFHANAEFRPADAAGAALATSLRAEVRVANPWGARAEPAGAFLEVSPASVRLLSLASAGPDRMRMRLEETTGEGTRTSVRPHAPATRAWVEDLFGQSTRELPVRDGRVEVDLPAFGMVTVGWSA